MTIITTGDISLKKVYCIEIISIKRGYKVQFMKCQKKKMIIFILVMHSSE